MPKILVLWGLFWCGATLWHCGPPYRPGERHVVDLHTHLSPGQELEAVRLFKASGVELAANLVGRPYGPGLEAALARAAQVNEAKLGVELLVFAGIDWELVDDASFGELAADNLREAVAHGAAGLKIFKSFGLGVRTADGRLLALYDPRLDPLFEAAGELDVPVMIHTGDPLAFFQAPTPQNERYEELADHLSWSFYGGDFPSLQALMADRDRLLTRHPHTRFVAVHMGGFPEDLASVAASLRAHPNLLVDVAARLPEIGRKDPAAVAAFFNEFQDRVLFGTDLAVSPYGYTLGSGGVHDAPTSDDVKRYYEVHWRYFETRDRNFPHMTPIQGRWSISGIGLSRRVLDKLYHDNALALLHRGHKGG